MCFSATASFTAGTGLLVMGAITTRLASRRKELAFAAIPLLFAVQQIIEGALWLTFPREVPLLKATLTYSYSIFSHVLWPIYVPIAVLLLEPVEWRRRVLTGIASAGFAAGIYLLYFIITLPIVARVQGQHIVYDSPHFYAVIVMILYVSGTCVSSVFSSFKLVRLFGLVSFLSFGATAVFYRTWFISVWCFFAAVLSSIILLHFLERSSSRSGQSRSATTAPLKPALQNGSSKHAPR